VTTISGIVKRLINDRPLLQEGLRQGLMNFAAVSEKIKPEIEQELGIKVKDAAIIMALRRHGESLQAKDSSKIKKLLNSRLILKTNLTYFSVKRSAQLFKRLEEVYHSFDYNAGDTLNIIHGNNEISVITDDKHEKKMDSAFENEHVTTKERNLVSISMSLPKEFPYTPGVIFAATRKLYWDNVNIFELVTTATELNFIFQKKEAMRAYASLQELQDQE
jgi:hypothetical protein